MALKQRKKSTVDDEEVKKAPGSKPKTAKKKRRGVTIDEDKKKDSEWNPDGLKLAAAFAEKYSKLGITGIKAEWKKEIENYKSPTYGDVAFMKNMFKNRFKEPDCLDSTRVSPCDTPDSSYINANWMYDMTKFSRQYILTQAPLETTTEDFWKMCFYRKAIAIVVLCDTKEDGNDVCYDFWPPEKGVSKNYGSIQVINKKFDNAQKEIQFTLEVLPEGCSNSQIVNLIQFKERDSPFSQSNSRNILKIIRVIAKLETIVQGPIIVLDDHSCQGRGAILTISDFTSALIYKGDKTFGLLDTVKWARRCRNLMVRTDEDYLCIIKTIFEYLFRTNQEKYRDQYEKICAKED